MSDPETVAETNKISDVAYIKLLEDMTDILKARLRSAYAGGECDHLWEQHWPCPLEANDIACSQAQCRYCGVEK